MASLIEHRNGRPRKFFFHYNKPAALAAGRPRVTVHWDGVCYILDNVVWKTATERLDVGKSYTLMGTVKEHKLYTGSRSGAPVEQTILTRCKVLDSR